ncbi:MAG: 50S ribosomal protein L3 [Desulfurococcaceae archaeon]
MGHRKKEAPRRGSLGVRPRKRASEMTPKVRSWPPKTWIELLYERLGEEASKLGVAPKPMLLGFAAYKAGMTHAVAIDDRPRTPTSGKEVFMPLTVLDAPPMLILAARSYKVADGALKCVGEAWRSPIDGLVKVYEELYKDNPFVEGLSARDVVRKYLHGLREVNHGLVRPSPGSEYGYSFIETDWESAFKEAFSGDVAYVSVIASTVPPLSGFGKKKPEIVEIRVGGGSIDEQIKYVEGLVGSAVTAFDVFLEGQLVDVIGITKGKGFQGVIKRFGAKELPRWHKHRKGSRKIGARSPGIGTFSEPPQPGQMGFHRRTDYNKRIIRMGRFGVEVVPKGGFVNYGLIYGPYIVLEGSVMGPPKRLLILRHPIRPPSRWLPTSTPALTYLSLESKQGA